MSGCKSVERLPADAEGVDAQGRDEMNLAEFPITALTDYVPRGQNTIRFGDAGGSVLITGSDAYGLPTAADADVVVALIQLTKRRNTFSSPTVHFTRAELLDILGWPESGKSYRRLTESLFRWSTTSLKYEGTWWDQRARRKINAVFHILNEVVLVDRAETGSGPGSSGGAGAPPLSYFTWNKIFLNSCQAGNLKRLDIRMYFALEHATSKRLYRFLDKRLHRQPDQTFDLAEVAFERVGLSRSYVGKKGGLNIGKVREKLHPAIEELEARGFLAPMSREDRYQKVGKGWAVRFVRCGGAPESAEDAAGEEPSSVTLEWMTPHPHPHPSPTAATAPESPAVVEKLVRRGVTRAKADDLARRFEEGLLTEKVELFDWKLARDAKGMKTNPAGWLVKAIEDGYPTPPGFESRADREAARRREQEAAEATRRDRAERRRRDRAAKAVDDYLARLRPDERAAVEAEAWAAAPDESRRACEAQGTAPSIRKALMTGLVREHVAARLASRADTPLLFY